MTWFADVGWDVSVLVSLLVGLCLGGLCVAGVVRRQKRRSRDARRSKRGARRGEKGVKTRYNAGGPSDSELVSNMPTISLLDSEVGTRRMSMPTVDQAEQNQLIETFVSELKKGVVARQHVEGAMTGRVSIKLDNSGRLLTWSALSKKEQQSSVGINDVIGVRKGTAGRQFASSAKASLCLTLLFNSDFAVDGLDMEFSEPVECEGMYVGLSMLLARNPQPAQALSV